MDILRRQALFNTLISSCVRTNSLEDVEASTMFEVRSWPVYPVLCTVHIYSTVVHR